MPTSRPAIERRRRRALTLLLGMSCGATAIAGRAPTGTPSAPPATVGSICIAAFHPDPGHGPSMDLPGPGPDSHYTFRVDGGEPVTLAVGERHRFDDVRADRRVVIAVRLDGKPTESLRVDLGNEPEHRLCLVLRRGYWHWVDGLLETSRGCTCWQDEPAPPPASASPGAAPRQAI